MENIETGNRDVTVNDLLVIDRRSDDNSEWIVNVLSISLKHISRETSLCSLFHDDVLLDKRW